MQMVNLGSNRNMARFRHVISYKRKRKFLRNAIQFDDQKSLKALLEAPYIKHIGRPFPSETVRTSPIVTITS